MRIDQSEIDALQCQLEECEQRIAEQQTVIDRLAALGAPTELGQQALRAMLATLDATDIRLAVLLANTKPRALQIETTGMVSVVGHTEAEIEEARRNSLIPMSRNMGGRT